MRLEAERRFAASEASRREPSPEDSRLLVRELSIRQIELEMQITDINERRGDETKYGSLFREMLNGFALHEIVCDGRGVPVDYRFLDVNPAFERMTGLLADRIVGRTVLEVMPGIEPRWIETYGKWRSLANRSTSRTLPPT
jgi:PAS domain-containing protein